MIFAEIRDHDGMTPTALAIAVYVFYRDVEAVAVLADLKRQRFPVDRGILGCFGKELDGDVNLNRIFKGLNDLAGQCGDSAEDVDRTALDAVLVLEGDVAVFNLDSNRNQNRVAGYAHKVGANIERHEVVSDFAGDDFFQIFELNGRGCLKFGKLLEAVELLGLQVLVERTSAQLLQAAISEAVDLARHAHLLIERKAGVRRVLEGVFFGPVDRHVIVVTHAGVDEFDHYFLANTLDVAIAPRFKRERGSLATAFFLRAFVGTAGGVRIDLIGWTKDDVHVAPVSLPAGDAGREVLAGVWAT